MSSKSRRKKNAREWNEFRLWADRIMNEQKRKKARVKRKPQHMKSENICHRPQSSALFLVKIQNFKMSFKIWQRAHVNTAEWIICKWFKNDSLDTIFLIFKFDWKNRKLFLIFSTVFFSSWTIFAHAVAQRIVKNRHRAKDRVSAKKKEICARQKTEKETKARDKRKK